MGKVIEIDKDTTRSELDKELAKLPTKKAPIDLSKYDGKVNFGVDGLDYQLSIRNE